MPGVVVCPRTRSWQPHLQFAVSQGFFRKGVAEDDKLAATSAVRFFMGCGQEALSKCTHQLGLLGRGLHGGDDWEEMLLARSQQILIQ